MPSMEILLTPEKLASLLGVPRAVVDAYLKWASPVPATAIVHEDGVRITLPRVDSPIVKAIREAGLSHDEWAGKGKAKRSRRAEAW